MTTTETIRTLRAALAPFAGAWDETHAYLPDTTNDRVRATNAVGDIIAEHWKEASRAYRDTTHATSPQEPRTRVREQLAALDALYESMLSRKAALDVMIAESRSLIDTYKEAGE